MSTLTTNPSLPLYLAKVLLAGQKQRRHVEPQGREEAAVQADAAGALRHTVLSVSPLKVSPAAAHVTGMVP